MSTEEELTKKIADLGEQIKAAKTAKKPKEEWDPLLKEMLATKVCRVCYLVIEEGSLFLSFSASSISVSVSYFFFMYSIPFHSTPLHHLFHYL
jgi:hypothetical protein